MYNRVGRALLIVGRQYRKKLCENSCNNVGAVICAASTAIHWAPNKYAFQRSYCDHKYTDETEDDIPKLISRDEEGAIILKKFLSVPENEKIYKIIEMEIEIARQNSDKVPDAVKPRHWAELIGLDSRSKRRRYLAFLWGLEKKKENEQKAKDEKRKAYEDAVADGEFEKPLYSLGSNAMFLRFYDQTMNRMWNGRLINQIMFGQKIVLDCGYEDHMTPREIRNCAKQLQLSFATNRVHHDPFNMYFCNANPQGELMKILHRSMPTMYDSDFPLNFEPRSYLDVFDKNQLVYLTPHCNQEMHEFNHDTVYIIGAFVDKASNEPVSMAKAKKEGLKMAKFPLDKYLQWGSSSGKNLTLNQVLDILLDLRMHGSWEKALKFVPRRKLQEARVAALERKVRHTFDVASVFKENYDDNETIQKIAPLQEIRPKVGIRYNADNSVPKPRRSNEYRASYPRDFKSNTRRDSTSKYVEHSGAGGLQDFSLKSRAKFKNNWKN